MPRNRRRSLFSDALDVGEQHFDFITSVASHIASGLMDGANVLAERSVRSALGFHRTLSAAGLPGSEDDVVGFDECKCLFLEARHSLRNELPAG